MSEDKDTKPTVSSDENKLDSALKLKWVQALRGGTYRQGHGQLCQVSRDGCGAAFCCLGVLADIVGVDRDRLYASETLSSVGRDDLLGPWGKPNDRMFISGEKETHTTTQRRLAALNDTGKSFAEIADYIEANL